SRRQRRVCARTWRGPCGSAQLARFRLKSEAAMLRRIVVVGASLAGLRATETLRARGFDGELTLIGDEPHRPYARPPLSKQLLQGSLAPGDTFFHRKDGDAPLSLH